MAVVVALAALVPRVADDLNAQTLTGALVPLSAQRSDLMAQWRGSPSLDDASVDPAAIYLGDAEGIRLEQPPPLVDLLTPPQLVAELGFPVAIRPPVSSGYYRVTADVLVDATLGDHAQLTSGAWPAPPTPDVAPTDVVVLDDAAARMGWAIGDEPFPGLRISGTFEPTDPGDKRWQHDPRGVRYAELVDPNLGTELVTAVFLDPSALAVGAMGERPQIQYRLWYGVDLDTAARGGTDLGLLAQQLTGMLTRSHTLPGDDPVPPVDMRLFSELNDALTAVGIQQRTLTSLVVALAIGPLSIALLVAAVACRAVSQRRSDSTALLVARGASQEQLRRQAAAEASGLALVAGVAGQVVADVAFPRPGMAWQWGVTAGVAAALAVGATALLSGAGSVRVVGRRRVAVETVLVGLAVVATLLLIGRGSSDSRVDVLAATAPILLTLASTAVIWRVLPLPLRLLARGLRRRPGLAPMLGVLRASRDPAGGVVSLLAVVAGVSMAFLGVAMSGSLAATADAAAWSANGADINVSGPRMSDEVVARVRQIEGVEHVATIARLTDGAAVASVAGGGHVGVWAADRELSDVYTETPLDPGLPAELFDGSSPPAVLLGGAAPHAQGAGTLAGLGDVRFLGHPQALPGVGTQPAWALVSAEAWAEETGSPALANLALVSVADGASPDDVAAAIREQLDTAVVTTTDGRLREHGVPAAAAFGRAVDAATAVTLALMIAAVLGAESVGARARRRDLDLLAALGMGAGARRGSVMWEVAPTLVLSMLAGASLGAGLAWLLLESLDFSFITGASSATFWLDPVAMARVVGLVVVSFVAVAAIAGGRSRPVRPREDT